MSCCSCLITTTTTASSSVNCKLHTRQGVGVNHLFRSLTSVSTLSVSHTREWAVVRPETRSLLTPCREWVRLLSSKEKYLFLTLVFLSSPLSLLQHLNTLQRSELDLFFFRKQGRWVLDKQGQVCSIDLKSSRWFVSRVSLWSVREQTLSLPHHLYLLTSVTDGHLYPLHHNMHGRCQRSCL